MLAGKETLVAAVPPEVAANLPVAVAVVVRPTVVAVALVVALPNASSRVTVKALVGEVLAPPLKAFEVMASCVPVPPVMVSCWVAEGVSPVAAAVMVGVPILGVAVVRGHGLLYWPARVTSLVTFAPPEVAANS